MCVFLIKLDPRIVWDAWILLVFSIDSCLLTCAKNSTMPGSPSPFCTSTIFRASLTFSDKACSCQCMFKLTATSSLIHHLPWLGGPCSSIKALSSYIVWLDPEWISHSTSSRAQEAGSRYASLPVCHLAFKAQARRWLTSEEVLHYFKTQPLFHRNLLPCVVA